MCQIKEGMEMLDEFDHDLIVGSAPSRQAAELIGRCDTLAVFARTC